MAPVIELEHITKYYGKTVAVNDLSLDVQPGEVMGLLGPNGAGKSTTLHIITGLLHPTAGTVSLFGKDLHKDFIEIAGRMGVLLERPAFPEHLTSRRILKLHARLSGRDVNLDHILDLAGMLPWANVKAGNLAQGLRQRLGLALAMLTEPELLILDEPTSGLDVESTQEITSLIRRLADEANVTVLLSSHMLHEVEQLCDRVAIINQGKLIACERTDVLISYDQSHVEVLMDGEEKAAKRLGEQPWILDVKIKPGRLLVHLKEDGNVNQLASFLVNAGFPVSGIIPKRRTLKDYFLKAINQ